MKAYKKEKINFEKVTNNQCKPRTNFELTCLYHDVLFSTIFTCLLLVFTLPKLPLKSVERAYVETEMLHDKNKNLDNH